MAAEMDPFIYQPMLTYLGNKRVLIPFVQDGIFYAGGRGGLGGGAGAHESVPPTKL